MSLEVNEFYGKDVASAIKDACEKLGVAQENLDIEVLETGSTGIFGLIRKKAHIKVTIQPQEEAEPAEPAEPRPAKRKSKKKSSPKKETAAPSQKSSEPEKTAAEPADPQERIEEEKRVPEVVDLSEENIALIRTELENILTLMTCPSEVTVEVVENNVLCRVSGSYEDDLTGQDGRTLDSLQYLLRKIVSRKISDKIRLSIDVGDYRERRNQELKDLAVDYAALVKQNGKTQVIPSLNPSERRIVHVALQDDGDIRSRSVGEGLFKKVLIYKPGKGKKNNGRRKNRSRGRKKADSGQTKDA